MSYVKNASKYLTFCDWRFMFVGTYVYRSICLHICGEWVHVYVCLFVEAEFDTRWLICFSHVFQKEMLTLNRKHIGTTSLDSHAASRILYFCLPGLGYWWDVIPAKHLFNFWDLNCHPMPVWKILSTETSPYSCRTLRQLWGHFWALLVLVP